MSYRKICNHGKILIMNPKGKLKTNLVGHWGGPVGRALVRHWGGSVGRTLVAAPGNPSSIPGIYSGRRELVPVENQFSSSTMCPGITNSGHQVCATRTFTIWAIWPAQHYVFNKESYFPPHRFRYWPNWSNEGMKTAHTQRHTDRKAGIGWAVLVLAEVTNCNWDVSLFILYI